MNLRWLHLGLHLGLGCSMRQVLHLGMHLWLHLGLGLRLHDSSSSKLLLQHLLLLHDQLLPFHLPLHLQLVLVLRALRVQDVQPLLLQGLVVVILLLLLLAEEGKLLFHLHPCQHRLLLLLLFELLNVLVPHAVQGHPGLLGFIQLLEDAFLVGCG